MNCQNRSKESFENWGQPQHYKDNIDSILLQLPQFNIINSIVIDSIHLLYLGVYNENFVGKMYNKKRIS